MKFFISGLLMFLIGSWRQASIILKIIIIFLLFFIAAQCKTITKSDPIHAERLAEIAKTEPDSVKKDILTRAVKALRETTERADYAENKAEKYQTSADKWAVSKWWLAGAGVFAVVLGFLFIRFAN